MTNEHSDTAGSEGQFEAGPLIEQIFELWVEPELERRGQALDRDEVTKVVVEFVPGQPIRVFLNEEANIIAQVRATREIKKDEVVTFADFDEIKEIQPYEVGADSGWVCFARIGDLQVVAFDFRRNRARARKLLDLAEEYAATARDAQRDERVGPAMENAFAAAELAVVAEMLVFVADNVPRNHEERRRWWADWTGLGNAPSEHGRTLSYLAARRHEARYGEGSVRTRAQHLEKLLTNVEEMIEHARSATRREASAVA